MGCLGAGEGLAKRAPPPPTTLPCNSAPQLVPFYDHTKPLRLTNSPDLQGPPPSPPDLENGMRFRGNSQVPPSLAAFQPPGIHHPRGLGEQGTPPSLGLAGIFLLSLLPYQSSACSPTGQRASPRDPSQTCLCQPVASCPGAKRVIVPEGMKEEGTGIQEPSARRSGSDPRAWAGPHSGYSPGPAVPGGRASGDPGAVLRVRPEFRGRLPCTLLEGELAAMQVESPRPLEPLVQPRPWEMTSDY